MWLKNVFLLLASLIFALVLGELLLVAMGKYSDLANTKLRPANTVWSRYPEHSTLRRHPDLRIKIKLSYDELGLRREGPESAKDVHQGIGLFGDSFTENRRIEGRFTIGSFFNAYLGQKKVVNFGVDGFGLEQSYQRYLNLKDKVDLKDVVYVFCANDLRNLYEVNLFEVRETKGGVELSNRIDDGSFDDRFQTIFRMLGQLRLTYLVIDAWQQSRARKGVRGVVQDELVGIGPRRDWRKRFHDRFADGISKDAVSANPSDKTKRLIAKFNTVLRHWRSAVEKDGRRFHVAVLPRGVDRTLFKAVVEPDCCNVIRLGTTKSLDALKSYSSRFARDDHWNEMGNLAAVDSLLRYFAGLGAVRLEKPLSDLFRVKSEEILAYYRENGGRPNAAGAREY